MKYIIGTGWWCDGTGIHTHSNHQKTVDKETRQKDFFNLWYTSIKKFTNPKKIIVIDSNSPVKPDLRDKDVILHSLDKNYGASLDGTRNKQLSGWDRSILLSASMAFFEDIDYFVYIEQDCLIYGNGIIEYAIDKMGKLPIMLGSGKNTPQPIQQSFIIIKKDFIPTFLNIETTLNTTQLTIDSEKRYADEFKKYYTFLPFGYGRQRPINYKEKYFYAQHLNTEELKEFKKILK